MFRDRSFAMLEWVSVLFLQTLPRAPLLLEYTTKDSNRDKEVVKVVARGLFSGLQVGHLLGMYKFWGLNF